MRPFDPHRRRLLHILIGICLFGSSAHDCPGQILINEFLFRDIDPRLEFVEILNRTDTAIDLRRFGLSDSRRARIPISTHPLLLGPGAFLVLVRDTVAFDARFDTRRMELASWPALNNGGDSILLWGPDAPVDSVSYDGSWGASGRSMEKVDPLAPSSNVANWKPSEHASGGTPGSRNSVFDPDTSPPGVIDVEEWTDRSIIVYVSEPLDPTVLTTARFRFASGDQPISARLSTDRMRIFLEPRLDADRSSLAVERLVDGSGNLAGSIRMLVARQPQSRDIILSEVLYEPNADAFDGVPDQTEFVEIQSLANHPIAMRGFYLTGRPTELGLADTLRSDDRPMRLRAEGFGFFHASAPSKVSFSEAFPSVPADTVATRAPVRRSSLSLDNNGDMVRLHAADGRILDEVTYSPSWHRPEQSITRGTSLERVSVLAATEDRLNWTTSVSAEGATPGRTNSVSLSGYIRGADVVSATPSPFSPDGDGWEDQTRIDVHTGRPSTSLAVWIFDAAGRLVRSIAEARAVGPDASLIWDGRDDADRVVPTGIFIIFVEAVDTSAGDVIRSKTPVVVARSF